MDLSPKLYVDNFHTVASAKKFQDCRSFFFLRFFLQAGSLRCKWSLISSCEPLVDSVITSKGTEFNCSPDLMKVSAQRPSQIPTTDSRRLNTFTEGIFSIFSVNDNRRLSFSVVCMIGL